MSFGMGSLTSQVATRTHCCYEWGWQLGCDDKVGGDTRRRGTLTGAVSPAFGDGPGAVVTLKIVGSVFIMISKW